MCSLKKRKLTHSRVCWVIAALRKNKTNRGIFRTQSNIYDKLTQPAIASSKLTIEALEQGMKYVQS